LIAKHAAVTQAGGDDAATVQRVEDAIKNSPMGWLQSMMGEVDSRAASEKGQVQGKIAEQQSLVSQNQDKAPKEAGPAPAPGPATHPAVTSPTAAPHSGSTTPAPATGGTPAQHAPIPGAAVQRSGPAAAAPAAAPAPTIASAIAGAGSDSQLDGILNAYAPKAQQTSQTLGRIKQMGDIAQGFNGQLDVYVAQGGAVEKGIAATANFLGTGKDVSAVWANNPYRKVHGILGGIMTGLSAVKNVCSVVGNICGKLGIVLTVIGLLGMIFPPVGVAVSGIARILNVVGVICDAVSFALSGILTGLNGVVLAQQIASGASAEEKAATADLMMSEANDAASGFINMAMIFGPKFMKGMLSSSKGVVGALLRRAKAVIGRVSIKASGDLKLFASKVVRKLGFGGAALDRVGGAWKDTGIVARTKTAIGESRVGQAWNSAPEHLEAMQNKLMSRYGNTAFAKGLDRVGAWSGTVASKFDLEEKVGDLGERAGKSVGNAGADTAFAKRMSAAADQSELDTRRLAMQVDARDAAHLEQTRWQNTLDKRAAANPDGLRNEAVEQKFIAQQGARVQSDAATDFESKEAKSATTAKIDDMKKARFERHRDEYFENEKNAFTGKDARTMQMDTLHDSRAKRFQLETQFKAQDAERADLLAKAGRSAEDDTKLASLNTTLKPLDDARHMNEVHEGDLANLAAGGEGARHPDYKNWGDVGANVWSAVDPALELGGIKDRPAEWQSAEKATLKKQVKFDKGKASGNAASRGGHGTYADIASTAQQAQMADFSAFVRSSTRPRSLGSSVRSILSPITNRPGAAAPQPVASAPAPASTTKSPTPAQGPAPVAPPAVSEAMVVTPQVVDGGAVANTNTPAAANANAPAEPAAPAPTVASVAMAAMEEAAAEPLPYWPAMMPEFDRASSDFNWMRKVAVEFKKAQIEGKQKAVDTLAVYGRYQEYAKLRAAAAAAHASATQTTAQSAQQNVSAAGQSEQHGAQGEAKQGEARGAANDRAAVDLPEPESRGFWGRILGAVKRWAKDKAAQVFGWIQEKIASVVLKGLCGVSMGDMREYAGALKRQQAAAHGVATGAGSTAGQAQQTAIKLGSDATKEAQSAADAIGECDQNITDVDNFTSDVTQFEQQLAEEKAFAQTFLAQLHAEVQAQQAKQKSDAAAEAAADARANAAGTAAAAGGGGVAGVAMAAMTATAAEPQAHEEAKAQPAEPQQPADTGDTAAIHSAASYVGAQGDSLSTALETRADDYHNQLKLALTNHTGKDASGVDLQGPAKKGSKTIVEEFKTVAQHTKTDMDGFASMSIDPSSAHKIADTIIQSADHLEDAFGHSEHALDDLFERTYAGIRDGKRTLKSRLLDGNNMVGQANHAGDDVTNKTIDTSLPTMTTAWNNVSKPIQVASNAPAPAAAPVQRKADGGATSEAPAETAKAGLGSGGALPHGDRIQAAFGRHDVSGIRAHTGAGVDQSAKAIGATAYATGENVAFAGGTPDLHTAAHEAAHVVQQRQGVQLKGGIDGGKSDPHEQHADAVADAVVAGKSAEGLLDDVKGGGGKSAVQRDGGAPTTANAMLVTGAVAASVADRPVIIVDDNAQVANNQVRRTDFLAKVEPALRTAASEELGMLGSAAACPYITHYLAIYSGRPAAEVEALVRKFTGSTARDPQQLELDLLARVRQGVREWKASGKLPADLVAADPAAAQAQQQPAANAPPGANVQRKSLDALEQRLGSGEAVDQKASAPMGAGDARVHRGAEADKMAAEHDAVAFAAGNNVVMSSNAPKQGTPAGDALLAHELAHTAQQKDAAKDPTERTKPIGGESAAAEKNADHVAEGAIVDNSNAARFSAFAGRASEAMRTNVQLQRCSTEAASKDVRGNDYLAQHLPEIMATAADQIETLPFATGDGAAKWASGGNQKFAKALAGQLRGGDVNLDSLLLPERAAVLVDTSRVMTQQQVTDPDGTQRTQNSNYGPDRFFEGTGITIANAIARRTSESLKREVPRYVQAKQATVGEPSANGLMVSHPIDPLILTALAAGGVLDIDQAAFAKEHPELAGQPKAVTPLPQGSLIHETDPKRKDWWRLTLPTPAPAEQIAVTLGMPMTDAWRIEVAHPLYGVKDKDGGNLIEGLQDAKEDAFVDEIALNQAASLGLPSTSSSLDVIAQIRMNAVMVRTSLNESAMALGISSLTAFADKLSQRATTFENAKNDAETKKWDVQSKAQAAIIKTASDGLDLDRKRQKTYADQFKQQIPEQQANVLFEDAQMWVAAVETSDAVKTAEGMIQQAQRHSMTLEMDVMEQQLQDVQLAADLPNQDKDSNVTNDFKPSELSGGEIEQRKKLSAMRAQMLADPTKLDPASDQVGANNAALVFKSHVVMQAEQMDQAFRILVDTSGFWAWVVGDSSTIKALETEGKGYYDQWSTIYAQIKAAGDDAKKLAAAQTAYSKLVGNYSFQSYLSTVQKQVQKTQQKQMIAKLIGMVVITIVSMGVGTVVEGLVGGAAVVAGAAEGGSEVVGAVTAGAGATRLGAQAAGFFAETATFTLASNLTMSKKHDLGTIFTEFGKNVMMFGAMRGLGKLLEVAGAGKIIKAGAAEDATLGAKVAGTGAKLSMDVAMGGAGVLAGYIEAKIQAALSNQNLTDQQVDDMIKMNVYQAIIMVIVGRVMQSPMASLKIDAAYQGSKWRMASQMRGQLAALAGGYEGKPITEAQAHELIMKDLAQLEAERAAFEEVRTALEAKGKDTTGVDAHLAELDKFANASKSSLLMVGLKAQGANHYTCPAADVKTLVDQQKGIPGTTVELSPGRTGEPDTWVITNQAGEKIFVTEEAPAWAQTAEGQRMLAAAKSAGVKDLVLKMSDAERISIEKLARAIDAGDKPKIEQAKKELAKLSKVQQDNLADALAQDKGGSVSKQEQSPQDLINTLAEKQSLAEQHAHAQGSVPVDSVLAERSDMTVEERTKQIADLEEVIEELPREISDLRPDAMTAQGEVMTPEKRVLLNHEADDLNAEQGIANHLRNAKMALNNAVAARAPRAQVNALRANVTSALQAYREHLSMHKSDYATYASDVKTGHEFFVRYKMITGHDLSPREIADSRASAKQLGMQELRVSSKGDVAEVLAMAKDLNAANAEAAKNGDNTDVSLILNTTKTQSAKPDQVEGMVSKVEAWYGDRDLQDAVSGTDNAGVEKANLPPAKMWKMNATQAFMNAKVIRAELTDHLPPNERDAFVESLSRVLGSSKETAAAKLEHFESMNLEGAIADVKGRNAGDAIAIDSTTGTITEKFGGLTMEDAATTTREVRDALRAHRAEVGDARQLPKTLGSTIHAGEQLKDMDPFELLKQVEQAINLGADRIGHALIIGIDPAVLVSMKQLSPERVPEFTARQTAVREHVKAAGVVVEANITSNTEISNLDAGAHPAKDLVKDGVRVSVSTDDETTLNTTVKDELHRLAAAPGISRTDVAEVILEGYFSRMGARELKNRASLKATFNDALVSGLSGPPATTLANALAQRFHVSATDGDYAATIGRVLDTVFGTGG
jgi:hypothetical protein